MYEDLSQEELEVVLEAGLEKVAYEEGVNEYINSLEKVASVHEVDPEDLHDFLEKQAEEKGKIQKAKKWAKENPTKTLAGVGALAGAGLGARKGYRSGQGYLDARRDMAQQAKEILGDSDLHLSPKQEKLRLALQTGSYGAAGGSLGVGAGALTGLGINKLRRNKKEEN